jgi:N-acetylmuramoyl-L-alanine amidase
MVSKIPANDFNKGPKTLFLLSVNSLQLAKLMNFYLWAMEYKKQTRLSFINGQFFILLMIALLIFLIRPSFAQDGNYYITTVCIDAGHGGKDPGAVSKLGKEKDINLSVALKLGKYITDNYKDVKVVYTRKTDEFVELYKRAEIANKNKADLFISIHVNANKKTEAHGAETFVMGLHKTQGNLETAMLENSAILKEENYKEQYEGFDPKSPEAFIIFTMYQNTYLEQSLLLSSLIQEEFRDAVKREDRGVKQAGFMVLWKTTMPSVLIELGFISNDDEATFLLKDENQDKMAAAIFRAFRNYKNIAEGKVKETNIKSHEYVKEVSENKTVTDTIKKPEVVVQKTENDSASFQKAAEIFIEKNLIPDTGIVFKIQITTSSKSIPVNAENFKGLKEIQEISGDGVYRYYFSRFITYSEASSKQKQIRELYPDAFIVAFRNGKKIPVSEAIK